MTANLNRSRNHWEFYIDSKEGWRWRCKDTNGLIMFISAESYERREDAEQCARRAGWVEDASHTVVEGQV
jgi:uncharacterized protein YegP (UPF0339 family)